MTTETQNNQPDPSILSGLSYLGGAGLTVAVIALGVGVADPNVDSNLIGLLVLAGVAALITAIIAWYFVVQPQKNFDDINKPLEDDHGHGHSHDEEDHEAEAHH